MPFVVTGGPAGFAFCALAATEKASRQTAAATICFVNLVNLVTRVACIRPPDVVIWIGLCRRCPSVNLDGTTSTAPNMTPRLQVILVTTLLAGRVPFTPLGAQTSTTDESRQRPPAFSTGVTAGAMSFSGGRSEQGVAVMLQYAATPWLTLSAAPGFAHTNFGQTSTTGLTDVPLGAGVWRTLNDVQWSPTISGSLYTTLSPSSGTSGVGIGRNTFGVSAAVSGWATRELNLTVGASH